jgi:hypothetical protein
MHSGKNKKLKKPPLPKPIVKELDKTTNEPEPRLNLGVLPDHDLKKNLGCG